MSYIERREGMYVSFSLLFWNGNGVYEGLKGKEMASGKEEKELEWMITYPLPAVSR